MYDSMRTFNIFIMLRILSYKDIQHIHHAKYLKLKTPTLALVGKFATSASFISGR